LSILDDLNQLQANDPENMYNRIFDLPEQMQDALRIGQSWQIDANDFADIKNIVIVGMGGSAIGGDLARTFLQKKLLVPFSICRHYELPEYVDDESLVIASSYSGNTEETLAAVDDAINRKAMIAAMTTNGMLEDVCKLNDIPYVTLPAGLQPRAALGYSFIPLMVFFEKIKLIRNVSSEVEKIVNGLKRFRDAYIEGNKAEENPAKSLAEKIKGRIPIIYTGPTLMDAVGIRWKGQICENSKNLAFVNQFAEFNHNELVGWSDVAARFKDQLIVIMLHDQDDHPQIKKRMGIVKELIKKIGVEVVDIESQGDTVLTRMFGLIQYGDFVSYYLAALNHVDPTPVHVIQELKGALLQKA
jgi:glucose/mannose-6-phosphate isomerase